MKMAQLLIATVTIILIALTSVPPNTAIPTTATPMDRKTDSVTTRENFNFFFHPPKKTSRDRLEPECEARPGIEELYREQVKTFHSCVVTTSAGRSKRAFFPCLILGLAMSEFTFSPEVTLPEIVALMTRIQMVSLMEKSPLRPWILFSSMRDCWGKVGDFVNKCIPGAKQLKAFLDVAAEVTGGPENNGEPTITYIEQVLDCTSASAQEKIKSDPRLSNATEELKLVLSTDRILECITRELLGPNREPCRGIRGVHEKCVQKNLGDCEKHPELANKTVSLVKQLYIQVGCPLNLPDVEGGEPEMEDKEYTSN